MNGNKVLFANVYPTTGDLPSATTYHGMFAHVHGTGKGYFAHAGNWVELVDKDSTGISGASGNAELAGTLKVTGNIIPTNAGINSIGDGAGQKFNKLHVNNIDLYDGVPVITFNAGSSNGKTLLKSNQIVHKYSFTNYWYTCIRQ